MQCARCRAAGLLAAEMDDGAGLRTLVTRAGGTVVDALPDRLGEDPASQARTRLKLQHAVQGLSVGDWSSRPTLERCDMLHAVAVAGGREVGWEGAGVGPKAPGQCRGDHPAWAHRADQCADAAAAGPPRKRAVQVLEFQVTPAVLACVPTSADSTGLPPTGRMRASMHHMMGTP